jgi:hypothetical protein
MSEVDKFKVEDGSCPIDLEDIYKMFYILVRQNQEANPGTVLSFPLEVFKTLPQKIQIAFEKKDGRLFCSVPYEEGRSSRKKKKSVLLLPPDGIFLS